LCRKPRGGGLPIGIPLPTSTPSGFPIPRERYNEMYQTPYK